MRGDPIQLSKYFTNIESSLVFELLHGAMQTAAISLAVTSPVRQRVLQPSFRIKEFSYLLEFLEALNS